MDSPQKKPTGALTFMAAVLIVSVFLIVETTGPETGENVVAPATTSIDVVAPDESAVPTDLPAIPFHITTPDPLHGIYSTGWTAGTTKGLNHILGLFDHSILNAVVIDIKDATGKLSYEPLDPHLAAMHVGTRRIAHVDSVIQQFHEKGVYVIGRIAVFQDPFYAPLHPKDALLDSRTGKPWNDYKYTAWLRPDSEAVQSYINDIARDAYNQGFDEINLDYVRFPSDGALKYIDLTEFKKNKADTMQDFFRAMGTTFRQEGIPVSADVFGLTMSAADDVGIGQKATLIAPWVDALAPMVYPSHFYNGSYGIPVPAKEPYKVIHTSLSDGIAKLAAVNIPKEKLRPWLQDFDLVGVHYTPEMVEAQIQAAHDLGIDSWVLWDPRNIYSKEIFTPKDE